MALEDTGTDPLLGLLHFFSIHSRGTDKHLLTVYLSVSHIPKSGDSP